MAADRRRTEFSLDRRADLVARGLNGAVFERDGVTVTVSATRAFSRRENEIGQYKAMLDLQSGVLYGIPSRHVALPGLVTENGSCVVLDAGTVQVEGEEVKQATRPSHIAKALGLDKAAVANVILVDPTIPRFRVE